MTFNELLVYGTPILLVVLATLVVVAGFGAGMHFEPLLRRIGAPAVPALLLAGFTLAILVSGRNVSYYGLTGTPDLGGTSSLGNWFLRLATLGAVAFGVVTGMTALWLRRRGPAPARALLYAFVLFYVSSHVVNSFLGSEFSVTYKLLYPLLAVLGLYLTADQGEAVLIRVTKTALLVALTLGLALLPWQPELVRQNGYSGFLPGINFRYWGLTAHANNAGPLAVFFALLLAWQPYRRWWLNVVSVAVLLAVLLMSQSKTAIATLLLVLLIVAARWVWVVLQQSSQRSGRAVAVLALLIVLGVAALGVIVGGWHETAFDSVAQRLQGRASVFTGREVIWQVTLQEWARNVWFGYGPELWSDAYSRRFGFAGVASNSHNQVIETLGSSGIVGTTGLLIYAGVLLSFAIRLAPRSRGVSLALLALLVVRGISEVPLKAMNITTSDFFMHCAVLAIFMRAAVSQAAEPRPAAATAAAPQYAQA